MLRKSYKNISRNIGSILNEARIKKGMSQEAIGDELDITKQAVEQQFSGTRTISLPRFIDYCVILEISPIRTMEQIVNDI